MPESVGSRAAEFGTQRQTEQARAENGVIKKKRCPNDQWCCGTGAGEVPYYRQTILASASRNAVDHCDPKNISFSD
jgi:hypothetical protein